MTKDELANLIEGCKAGEWAKQQRLYRQYHHYVMNVCARYARTDEETEEMADDVFVKVFTRLDQYDEGFPFMAWLRKIAVNTALDYLKKYRRSLHTEDLQVATECYVTEDLIDALSAVEIMGLVRRLAPSYRAVFNLFVIEGYSHSEIAAALEITESTSRGALLMARQRLQVFILDSHTIRL